MGHEDGSVQARYAHITPAMSERLLDGLTTLARGSGGPPGFQPRFADDSARSSPSGPGVVRRAQDRLPDFSQRGQRDEIEPAPRSAATGSDLGNSWWTKLGRIRTASSLFRGQM
jgi:hypothetical protein